MEKDNYKFDAFISYRHADLDKFVAENLHRLIETYKMPKSVVEKYNITDNNIRRVFRDKDELPLASNLENPIIEALKDSKFLIVICSPRLKDSIWCKKEIESFIKLHGRSNILCVLLEGEPKDSFPEILQYYEEKSIDEQGSEIIKRVPCEPLAMDVRGNNKKEIYKNLKNEFIRIIAPMYNLDYDDIKRRHEERELKRKANILRTVAIVSILFAVYSFFLFSRIYISSKQLKNDQSINLAKEANELLLNDNRISAVEKAYQSVTKYNNIKMPITTKGIYELTDSLGVYYLDEYIYPISQLDTLGVVRYIKTDLNNNYLLSYDTSGELVLWDLNKQTRIKTFTNTQQSINEEGFTFIGTKSFAYINNNKEIVILDFDGNEITKISLDIFPYKITSGETGNYLEIDNDDKIYFYETEKYTKISSYDIPKDMKIWGKSYFDENEENFIFTTKHGFSNSNSIKVLTYNLNNNDIINETIISSDEVKQVLFNTDNLVLLSQRKHEKSTDMIITSYNYKNGIINFQKEYNGEYALDMEVNLNNENNKTILVVGYGIAYLLDYNTGEQKAKYTIDGREVDLYPSPNEENYMLFTSSGYLYYISTKNNGYNDVDNNVVFSDVFNCHLSNYMRFLKTSVGYISFVGNDNRIVIYGLLKNDDIKKSNYEKKEFDKLLIKEINLIASEYNSKKKNLASKAFYSDDKKLLFITYTDNKLEIYNCETKELLKEIEIPINGSYLDSFIVKTEDNKYIIKGVGGYILNNNFDLIAYVPRLYDYKDGKLIIESYSNEYFEVKIYTEKELINKGRDYLNSKGIYVN